MTIRATNLQKNDLLEWRVVPLLDLSSPIVWIASYNDYLTAQIIRNPATISRRKEVTNCGDRYDNGDDNKEDLFPYRKGTLAKSTTHYEWKPSTMFRFCPT